MKHHPKKQPMFKRAGTGRRDRNGNEIKEGDIIKVRHFCYKGREFCTIFDEQSFFSRNIPGAYGKTKLQSWAEPTYYEYIYYRNYAVEYSEREAGFIGRNGSVQHPLKQLTNNYYTQSEIIGNIYENPELLEKEAEEDAEIH